MNEFRPPTPPIALSDRLAHSLLAAILAVYLVLAIGYGFIVPIFETPDEHLHYFTAEFIAREGRLPTTVDAGLMGQEAAQPPLYYALAALIVRAVPGSTLVSDDLWPNPMGDPADPRGESLAIPPINVNMFIHGAAEARPWRGYALAVHLVRMLSTIMGLGTLLCIYAAGRVVWPQARGQALLATALVAFLPQFAFIHGAVSNDAAITLFSAAALWQLLRITNDEWRITGEGRPQRTALVTLGVTIGLAMLSKAAGLLLLGYYAIVLSVAVWRRGGTRRGVEALRAASLVAIPALVVGGWLFVRNWQLYGDPTAANQFILFAGGLRPYTMAQVWHDMSRVWRSFFALFGWMNVRPPAWIWVAWNVIAVMSIIGGVAGLIVSIRRRRGTTRFQDLLLHPAIILSGWFILVALAWLQFMLRTPADQGRLFFPALAPLALGAAYGLSRWPRPWTQLVMIGLALITSTYSLVVVIPTAYARPPIVETIPADAHPLTIAFPAGLELLAARVDTPVVKPGEWVWATIYWRSRPDRVGDAPIAQLELFGRDFRRIGSLSAYHGRGNFPATLWPAEVIVADRLAARLDEDTAAPVAANLTIRLDEDGQRFDIGVVQVIPSEWPGMAEPLATLGDGIQLAAADFSPAAAAPGDTVTTRLRWQVIAPPGPGLRHVFVHLGDPTSPPLAQADGPVMGNEYPSALWAAGEVFEETLTLTLPGDLPPGEYPIHIGLYEFESGIRLPVTVDGERTATDVFTLDRPLTVRQVR